MKDMIELGNLKLNTAGRSEEKTLDAALPEKEFSQIYLRKLGALERSLRACLPDFLVISPPKTGTTWLFENLQHHPQIFMPENKELQYFTYYWRRYDINWYLRNFQKGLGLTKGESSPFYGSLPHFVLQLLYDLAPHLKLVFLMRHPTERAWSHIKHYYKYDTGAADNLPHPKIPEGDKSHASAVLDRTQLEMIHVSNDYLTDLQRWLSIFPKQQLYVGFYESIQREPVKLLTEVLAHLRVRAITDWSDFPTSAIINPGLQQAMPGSLKQVLNTLYQQPVADLAKFLSQEFNLELPPEWRSSVETTEAPDSPLSPSTSALSTLIQSTYQDYLASDREGWLRSAVTNFFSEINQAVLVEANYRGFNLVDYREKVYGLALSLGPVDVASLKSTTLEAYQRQGTCFIGASMEAVKQLISQAGSFSPKLVEKNYSGFNLVAYQGKVYGLALSLGPIDIPSLEATTLEAYQRRGTCFIGASMEEVKQLILQANLGLPKAIAEVSPQPDHQRRLPAEFADESPTLAPGLVEMDYEGFNIVLYQDRFYALAQKLGPIKLQELEARALDDYQARGHCLIADSLDEVKQLILKQFDYQTLEADYLQRLGELAPAGQAGRPDFLIIAPAKTGTTWLAENLRCHPEIFIPAIKEIHYFNIYWHRFDLNWYVKHFEPGDKRQKGEATPYAALPLYAIRGIQHYFPSLKLIFLLRDPIGRAWSQAKHEYKFRQGVFNSYPGDFADIPDQKFVEHFSDLHSINIGDYLVCLKRWLSCFKRDQMYVGFYESLQTDPQRLVRDVFDHLGVKQDIDLSKFPLNKRILPGLTEELPPRLKPYLQAIYAEKTKEFCVFLKEQFQLVPPPEWTTPRVVEALAPLLLEENYKGYNVFLYQSKFYALPPSLSYRLTELGEALSKHQTEGQCFSGYSLDEVKYYVDHPASKADREEYLGRAYQEIITNLSSRTTLPLQNYLGFNITLHHHQFYAFSPSVGPVDFTQLDEPTLREYRLRGVCCLADTLDALYQRLQKFPLSQLALQNYRRFNVVYYQGRYCGLAYTLGIVDVKQLTEQVLGEYQATGQAVLALSLDEARSLIDQIADQLAPPTVQEKFQGSNFARYQRKFFSLVQALKSWFAASRIKKGQSDR